jgi:hypothetical protein
MFWRQMLLKLGILYIRQGWITFHLYNVSTDVKKVGKLVEECDDCATSYQVFFLSGTKLVIKYCIKKSFYVSESDPFIFTVHFYVYTSKFISCISSTMLCRLLHRTMPEPSSPSHEPLLSSLRAVEVKACISTNHINDNTFKIYCGISAKHTLFRKIRTCMVLHASRRTYFCATYIAVRCVGSSYCWN